MWNQIEPTPAHLSYLVVSIFLILYALFSVFIRNSLHLSEPPLALLTGVVFGPHGVNALNPVSWKFGDNITQEVTRIITGIQVFVAAIELPRHYLNRHWRSLAMMLGPVMAFGWVVTAAFLCALLKIDLSTALVVAACLTPTDPVLAASILSNSRFSNRVPLRLKRLLSAEAGCNDGVSFPFLYVGLSILTKASFAASAREWIFITILWQCTLGTAIGLVIGYAANRLLRFSAGNKLIGHSAFLAFYLLLSVLAVGVGSTMGLDDFLVAFGAGVGFGHDGWFYDRTRGYELNNVVDLLLNSAFFVYFGTIIPWAQFSRPDLPLHPHLTPARLVAFLILVLCFRRLPAVLLLKRYIPDIKTYHEALFCGHFGPMGVGALFLAIEARAQLESGTSLPTPHPPEWDPQNPSSRIRALHLVWPVVCFVVLGSTLVHGLSVAAISVVMHFARDESKRAGAVGAETDPLGGMVHDHDGEGREQDEEETNSESEDSAEHESERNGRIALPRGSADP